MADYVTPPVHIKKKKSNFWGGFTSALAAEMQRRQALKDAMEQFKAQQDMAMAKQKELATFNTNEGVRAAELGAPIETKKRQSVFDITQFGQDLTPDVVGAIASPEEQQQYTGVIPKTGTTGLGGAIAGMRRQAADYKQNREMTPEEVAKEQAKRDTETSRTSRTERVAQWRIKNAKDIAAMANNTRLTIANMDDATRRELAMNEAGLKLQLRQLGVDASEQYAAGEAYKDAVVNGYMKHDDAIKVAMETVAARRSVKPEEPVPTPTPRPLTVTRPKGPGWTPGESPEVTTLKSQLKQAYQVAQSGDDSNPAVVQAKAKVKELMARLQKLGITSIEVD